jgi:hypothetical protein
MKPQTEKRRQAERFTSTAKSLIGTCDDLTRSFQETHRAYVKLHHIALRLRCQFPGDPKFVEVLQPENLKRIVGAEATRCLHADLLFDPEFPDELAARDLNTLIDNIAGTAKPLSETMAGVAKVLSEALHDHLTHLETLEK